MSTFIKKVGIPALIYLLVTSISLGPALAHASVRNAAYTGENSPPETEIELAPMSPFLVSTQVKANDHVISIPEETLEQISKECKIEAGPSATLSERCSRAVIHVLSSYPFVLSEIAFFFWWWIYNYFSPHPFDPAPTYAANGVTTTVLEEYFGTFDVMNQRSISSKRDFRVGLQQEVIEQSLDVVKTLKSYQLDPALGKEALQLSLESSKKLLTKLGFSPQGEHWQQHWAQAIQDLSKQGNFEDHSIDFISRNLRSPGYLIFLTLVLTTWITAQSTISHPIDPYPFPYLNTFLCALTTIEFSLILKVMKRRAAKEQQRDVITDLLDARHLIQIIGNAEAESGANPSAGGASLKIPDLDQIPVPPGSDPSTILGRSIQRINRVIASYPYVISILLASGGWIAFNCLTPNPVDPGPAFPALNVANAIIQEYYSSFEVMAQNSTNTEELRLARLHNSLLENTLDFTKFLSPGVSHSPEELKTKILEVKSFLKDHGLPVTAAEMDAFYQEKLDQINLNQDKVTDFVSNYLRSWGYLCFLTAMTVSWMIANSVSPRAIDPYPFVAFNIGLTIWITIQESFVIRIMLRQNDIGVMRRQKLYWLDAVKLTELLELAPAT